MFKNHFTGFDMESALAKVGAYSVSVRDHEMVTDTLARVILTYTGKLPSKEEARMCIAGLFKNMASAVEDSFRPLTTEGAVKSIVGFIKANREVRPWDPKNKAETAKFRVVASKSNLLMDKKDLSVWEVRRGASGSYIAKQGNENLSELVYLATARVGAGVAPRFAQTASVDASPQEFVGFVSTASEEMEHGFVISHSPATAKTDKAEAKPSSMLVLAHGSEEPVAVLASQLVDIRHLDRQDFADMGMKMATIASMDKLSVAEYYRKAYGFAPEYVAQVIKQINEMSFA